MRNMEPMSKLVSLLLVVTYLHPKAGISELIVFPRDTEVLFNQTTYFNCSTSIVNATIHWNHYRVRKNSTNYVYYKGQFNKFYSDRYSIGIDNRTGKYDLIIRSVQPEDAGRYECRDFEGLGIHRSAELIVLDFPPRCQSNMKPGGFVLSNPSVNELQLSCSVSYSGNIPPTLQWKMEGSDTPISRGILVDYSVKTVTVNLTKSLNVELKNTSFTCHATRSHDGKSTCTTEQVEVYSVEEETTKRLLLLILILIVAVLLIISIILFLKMRKDYFRCVSMKSANGVNSESQDIGLASQGNQVTDETNNVKETSGRIPNETKPLLQDVNDTVQICNGNIIITELPHKIERSIAGVAILGDLLYIVSHKSSEVEVENFELESFEFRNGSKLKELKSPCDMVSCKRNNCLYIMDRRSTDESNHIIYVDLNIKVKRQWPIGVESGNLSITSEGHIVVTFCHSSKLVIYKSDETILEVVSLSEHNIIHPTHALQVSSGQFLISYGLNKDNMQRVCVLDENGRRTFIKNSVEKMESPSYLAVVKDGVVFVADEGNNRVCALNSNLELIGEVHGLRSPQKICLHERNRKLCVADYEDSEFKEKDDELLIFVVDYEDFELERRLGKLKIFSYALCSDRKYSVNKSSSL